MIPTYVPYYPEKFNQNHPWGTLLFRLMNTGTNFVIFLLKSRYLQCALSNLAYSVPLLMVPVQYANMGCITCYCPHLKQQSESKYLKWLANSTIFNLPGVRTLNPCLGVVLNLSLFFFLTYKCHF